MKFSMLPFWWKYLGLSLLLLMTAVFVLLKWSDGFPLDKETGRQIANPLFFIGFLLIILSREKKEDEYINFCRLFAFRAAFLTGICLFIWAGLRHQETIGGFGILLTEALTYLGAFYATKQGWQHDE